MVLFRDNRVCLTLHPQAFNLQWDSREAKKMGLNAFLRRERKENSRKNSPVPQKHPLLAWLLKMFARLMTGLLNQKEHLVHFSALCGAPVREHSDCRFYPFILSVRASPLPAPSGRDRSA